MADLILIPVLALLFVGAKRYDNGFNKNYSVSYTHLTLPTT